MSASQFVRGNDKIAAALRKNPERAKRVAAIRAQMDEADHVYATTLAKVREAGQLTQVELASAWGVTQGAVSQTETRDDMLLSTLRGYLAAAGAENPRILVTVKGVDLEMAL
jgi:DNA-binding transcriptional regulator YiaG